MKNIRYFLEILKKLGYILTKEQKRKAGRIFVCILLSSVLELLSVSVMLPFIYAILEPQKLLKNRYIDAFLTVAGIKIVRPELLIYYLSIGIVLVFILRSIGLIAVNRYRLGYETSIMRDVADLIMGSYLSRPYKEVSNLNTAETLRGIGSSATGVYYVLQNIFLICTNLLTSALIIIFLFVVDAVMAVELILVTGGFLLIFFLLTQRATRRAGIEFNETMLYTNQYMTEAFNGLKEIHVLRRNEYFINRFKEQTEHKQRAERRFRFFQHYPTVIIQTIIMCTVVGIACLKIHAGIAPEMIVPTLGTFAYGAITIMPALIYVTNSISGILYYYDAFNDAYSNIHLARSFVEAKQLPMPTKSTGMTALDFERLDIKNLTWRYEGAETDVLRDLSLTIRKGECVGITGKSGAGKSTLVDIILGVLSPELQNCVTADGVDIFTIPEQWSHTVGYVPQQVFLMDDTIRNNVLFGAPKTNDTDELIWFALEQAQLKDFVETLPDGLDTIVGEHGSRLSGGQRQRISIARALYNDPELLVLDEATSALDNETETAVMESIEYLLGKKTMLIIAHRLTTIEHCDRVYEIIDGKAVLRK